MKTRLSRLSVAPLFLTLLLASASCGKKSGALSSEFEGLETETAGFNAQKIEGTWTTECARGEGALSKGQRTEIYVKGRKLEHREHYFKDAECDDSSYTMLSIYAVSEDGTVSADGAAFDLSSELKGIRLRVDSDDAAAKFNEWKACGMGEWRLSDEFRNVDGRSCDNGQSKLPAAGAKSRITVYFAPDKLNVKVGETPARDFKPL